MNTLSITSLLSDQSGAREESKSGLSSPKGNPVKDYSDPNKTPPKKKSLSPNAGD